MSEQLYSLCYISRNAIDNHDIVELSREIEAILRTARKSNAERKITGALVYSAGHFAQVLEGPLNEVEMTFERIQCDPRHRDVNILQLHPLEERRFSDWSMAFAGFDPDGLERARIDAALGDRGKAVTGPEALDFIAVLRGIIARNEIHG
jgi:hypothetical protein